MDIFDTLTFIGGLCLFLFGMTIMGKSLEKSAGGKLKNVINRMTTNRLTGVTTGMGVTAVIQSSSATTVMVVGFVNSGLMTLRQAINVIMGANIGTTITGWLLALTGIESNGNIFLQLLKPSSFSPILALIGVILFMFFKSDKKKNIGLVLLGFTTLMFGMETMASATKGLQEAEWFRNLFITFENNPFLGVLVGTFVTAIIQSSSASVGILQAFAISGQITFGAAIPIILGQNIGTCITALISSIGTNRNAKRASLVHLFFNLIGTVIVLIAYLIIKAVFAPAILSSSATLLGIAIIHSIFNVACVVLLFPFSGLLEKLVCKIIPDKKEDVFSEIDERLLSTPSIALEQVKRKLVEMCEQAKIALQNAIIMDKKDRYEVIHDAENKTDHYEDLIGTYLVKLSAKALRESDSKAVSVYLKIIGDLERIADHSLNIAKIKNEIAMNNVVFSEKATQELKTCFRALNDIWNLTCVCLKNEDNVTAKKVEPLEQVIDILVKTTKNNHISRIQNDECSINKGFVLADLLSNIERISDHCSNIAGYVIDYNGNNLNSHKNIHSYRDKEDFQELFQEYVRQYPIS